MPERQSGFATANGIRIFYVSCGEGPLVLLCHGFPEGWYSWRHQLEPLASAGFRAVAIDMPGYGRSDKPEVTYDVEWLTACLAELIGALGHERAVMVGHDWGGLLVWPFARLYPERTAAAVGLNAADIPRPPVPTTEFLKQLGSEHHGYILAFQERGAPEDLIESDVDGFVRMAFLSDVTVRKEVFTDDVLSVYADAFRPKGAITPPLEYYRNMDRNWELSESFDDRRIDAPALLISAEGDVLLPPSLGDGMEERVPKLRKVTIGDCGHWTQQEQPEETTGHLIGFLEDLHLGAGE